MKYKEFKYILFHYDMRAFFDLAHTCNLEDGIDIHHMCLLCGYKTSNSQITNSQYFDSIYDRIDGEMAHHLFRSHRNESIKVAQRIWAESVGKQEGQKKLEESL